MIWVRKTENTLGPYIDDSGKRYQVDWCVGMITPDGSGPDAHGYTRHESVEAAVATWNLSTYVDPTIENEILQFTENE